MIRLLRAACALTLASQAFAADTARVLTAAEFYQQALTHKLRVTSSGLGLEKAVLVEDDGPAAGINNNPDAWDQVRGASVIRKELVVDAVAPAAPAILLFWAEAGEGQPAPLEVEVNGHALRYTPGGLKYESFFAMPLPPGLLRAGTNTIAFRSPESGQGWGFYIAQDSDYPKGSRTLTSAPGRSGKSSDGGAHWSTQLGQRNALRGEYGVRLFFEQYTAEGSAVSPVLDLRTLAEPKTLVTPVEAGKLAIAAASDVPAGTRLQITWRSGATPFYQPDAWSDWNLVDSVSTEYTPHGRFIQLRTQFSTSDPSVSPRLSSLTLKSTYSDLPARTANLTVTEDHNQRIVESPVEFEYEPSDLPALREFRKSFNLDAVVAGATTELGVMVKLREWAARMHNITDGFPRRYPDWNAESIITRNTSGLSITGFCLQYNLVLLQACRAFGIQGRHFCIDGYAEMGHEIAEVWSNQFQKWIYLDAALDAYYSDPKTKIPSSLLELHRVYLGAFFRKAETVFSLDPAELARRVSDTGTHVPLRYSDGGYNYGKPVDDYAWWKDHGYLAAGKLRLTPRDNFLASVAPLPLKQGTMWPGWDGFVNWEDARTPRMPVHANYVDKETDLYWSLNQAQLVLLDGDNAGELRVALKNSMPFFHHYLIRENGGEWKEQAGGFAWKLASGSNRLEIKPVDRTGLAGIVSSVAVQRK